MRGEMHMGRNPQARLGVQTCRFCGAIIEVTEKRKGWAFYPRHQKPQFQQQASPLENKS